MWNHFLCFGSNPWWAIEVNHVKFPVRGKRLHHDRKIAPPLIKTKFRCLLCSFFACIQLAPLVVPSRSWLLFIWMILQPVPVSSTLIKGSKTNNMGYGFFCCCCCCVLHHPVVMENGNCRGCSMLKRGGNFPTDCFERVEKMTVEGQRFSQHQCNSEYVFLNVFKYFFSWVLTEMLTCMHFVILKIHKFCFLQPK